MSNEYIADVDCFRVRFPQRVMHLMKLPQLEIPSRTYAEILAEGRAQCTLRYLGRSRQFLHTNGFPVALLKQCLGTADNLRSRSFRSPYVFSLTHVSVSDDDRRDLQQFRRGAGRSGC